MKITFYGAAQEVTGSLFLVETAQGKVLVECGMHQGEKVAEEKNYEPFAFDPKIVDAVLVTHAHLDHIGRLPKLVKEGFSGKIFATAATAELAQIVLEDAQELMQEEAQKDGHEPLYRPADVALTISRFDLVEYKRIVEVVAGVSATFFDAGHILGSSSIQLGDGQNTAVFSGDLGNSGTPILPEKQPPLNAGIVVMESTYGGRVHEPAGEREKILRETILQTINKRGVLMIPAFAIERAQELLYELDSLSEAKKIPRVPVFLDSPMAIKATSVFSKYSDLWDRQAQNEKLSGNNIFQFDGLEKTLTVQASKRINDVPAPKVVIAGAGMMHGGRILHHAKRYLQDKKSTLLIVGYQAHGTPGRRLLDGERRIKIHGDWINVRANIKPIGAYSAHADSPQLVDWLSKINGVKKVALVHGEPQEMSSLRAQIKDKTGIIPQMPKLGDSIDL